MTNVAERRWFRQLVAYAPLFIWIGVIFYWSSGQGSHEQTSRFIGPMLAWLFPAESAETLAAYHGYIRKFAHFAAYAVLGALAFRSFHSSSLASRSMLAVRVLSLVIVIAVLDEFNQSFNPARTSSPVDVLIDLVGGGTALAVLMLIFWRRTLLKGSSSPHE